MKHVGSRGAAVHDPEASWPLALSLARTQFAHRVSVISRHNFVTVIGRNGLRRMVSLPGWTSTRTPNSAGVQLRTACPVRIFHQLLPSLKNCCVPSKGFWQ